MSLLLLYRNRNYFFLKYTSAETTTKSPGKPSSRPAAHFQSCIQWLKDLFYSNQRSIIISSEYLVNKTSRYWPSP